LYPQLLQINIKIRHTPMLVSQQVFQLMASLLLKLRVLLCLYPEFLHSLNVRIQAIPL
jgi:hypothetical protein